MFLFFRLDYEFGCVISSGHPGPNFDVKVSLGSCRLNAYRIVLHAIILTELVHARVRKLILFPVIQSWLLDLLVGLKVYSNKFFHETVDNKI